MFQVKKSSFDQRNLTEDLNTTEYEEYGEDYGEEGEEKEESEVQQNYKNDDWGAIKVKLDLYNHQQLQKKDFREG